MPDAALQHAMGERMVIALLNPGDADQAALVARNRKARRIRTRGVGETAAAAPRVAEIAALFEHFARGIK